MRGIDKEKVKWLDSIGAKEFPEPVKYIYGFSGFEGDFNLSERYVEETPLEELKEQYKSNYEFASNALEWRILQARRSHDLPHE